MIFAYTRAMHNTRSCSLTIVTLCIYCFLVKIVSHALMVVCLLTVSPVSHSEGLWFPGRGPAPLQTWKSQIWLSEDSGFARRLGASPAGSGVIGILKPSCTGSSKPIRQLNVSKENLCPHHHYTLGSYLVN